jgi:L-threonylcarbamoyladenylate synthase
MRFTEIEPIKNLLLNEEVVAIPTETVYGLAANIFSDNAIKKIFELKKRPFFNPLIVHIKSINYINHVAEEVPEAALKLAKAFWPGPLTLVLKKKPNVSDLITGGKNTVGIRVPNHALTLSLLNALDCPLAAPSANTFQSISPTLPAHVEKNFGQNVAILDGGSCKLGLESTILGFEKEKVILYRFGAISIEEIEKVVGKVHIQNNENVNPNAPGMLSKHYSPFTKIILTSDLKSEILKFQDSKIGVLQFRNMVKENQVYKIETLSENGDLSEAATNFYNALHLLDLSALDLIIAEKLPNVGLGKTINDRLTRAISR